MQCGVALGVNSIHLCAVLNQKPCHWNAAGLGRPHDRGAMEFVLGAGDTVYLTRRGMRSIFLRGQAREPPRGLLFVVQQHREGPHLGMLCRHVGRPPPLSIPGGDAASMT